MKRDRLARAATKKAELMKILQHNQMNLKHDHDYCGEVENRPFAATFIKAVQLPHHLVMKLYEEQVCLSDEAIAYLEKVTRLQSHSQEWHKARKFRVTASIMKEVSHRRATTPCDAFLQRKLAPSFKGNAATRYGLAHEKDVIAYKEHLSGLQGKEVQVQLCGLLVHSAAPWLDASPDALVVDMSEEGGKTEGCLEVKCPLECQKKTISKACKEVAGFCLLCDTDGKMTLSRMHQYYYQVQTQMHVARRQWCDFVVWSPVCDSPFVERISYDAQFMEEKLAKAEAFYFQHFLPAAVNHVLFKECASHIHADVHQDTSGAGVK